MKNRLMLIAFLAASSIASGTLAQGVGLGDTAAATPGVTIIDVTNSPSAGSGSRLPKTVSAPPPEVIQSAQAEVASDPAIQAALANGNVNPKHVIAIETAFNGGKIVYIR